MKRILFTCVILLFTLSAFSQMQFFRATWKDDPATSFVVGWTGDEAVIHYGKTDQGTNFAAYPFSQGVSRAVTHRGLENKFIELTGLEPKTTYYFVLRNSSGVLSRRMLFTTMSDNPNDCISFVSGGDTRDYIFFPDSPPPAGISSWRDVRQMGFRMLAKVRPSFIAFSGDFIGGSYQQGIKSIRRQWEEWLEDWQLTLQPDGRLLPIIPALGNHEEYDTKSIYDMFNIPSEANYFSLTFGGNLMKIYSLSSALASNQASNQQQATWLENSLRNDTMPGPGKIRWKMGQYHKPMYAQGHTYAAEPVQINTWAKAFETYGVRLGMEGHTHIYKVTWPCVPFGNSANQFFKKDDKFGTVYIGEGNMGAPLRVKRQPTAYTRELADNFSTFFYLVVNQDSITIRTVIFENENLVDQNLSNEQCGDLPGGVTLFDESKGAQNGSLVVVYPFGQDRVEVPVGVRDYDVNYAEIYPNPVDRYLTLQFGDNAPGKVTIELYDAVGRLQQSQVMENTRHRKIEFDMGSFIPGAYYVVIKSETAAQTVKVIKQ